MASWELIFVLIICSGSVFTANLGENCTKNNNCTISNSECTNEQCRCEQHYFEQNNQCVPGLGADCSGTTMCQAENSICGSTGRCICKPRFIYSNTNRCVPIRSYGEPCEENEQCSCLSDKKCKLDQTYKDIVCVNNKCGCQPGSHYAFRRMACVHNSGLGEQCNVNENCELTLFAECYNNKCVCNPNYFESEGKCKQGLGSSCLSSSKCSAVEHAECVKNKCKCMERFVEQSTELCVPVSYFGEQCEYVEQCTVYTANATCEANTDGAPKVCMCGTGQHHHISGCFVTKKLDERCDSDSECFVTSRYDSAICQENECVCVEGTIRVNETYCDGAGSIVASVLLVLFMVMFKSVV